MRSLRRILVLLAAACLFLLGWVACAGALGGFIENRGQVDSRVKYYCPGSRAAIYFTQDAVVIDLKEEVKSLQGRDPHKMPYGETEARVAADPRPQKGCTIYVRFEGANPSPVIEARGELETKYNYFLGNDPTRWQTEVPAYSEVVYRDVWPGVDLVFREEGGGRLTYQAVLSPGADAQVVRFGYEGGSRVVEEPDGSLLVETPAGTLREEISVGDGKVGALALTYGEGEPTGNGGSPAPADNPSSLVWSTFVNGSGMEYGYSVALDASGNALVAGQTWSSDFPTTPGAYDTSFNEGDQDAFVAKLSSSGSTLLWSTFLGGSGQDCGYSLALDASGNAVVTGETRSSDFPTTPGAYEESPRGALDAFVTKISASGSALLWSTFLGGSDLDLGYSLALGASGNVVVTGYAYSPDFPTTPGAFDTSFNGYCDVYVANLSASGSTLLWSTFLGGGWGYSLALDASGNAVVTGQTWAFDFPTTPGAYDTSYNGIYGCSDVFVTRISASGSTLLGSTFLGGSGQDCGYSLGLDASGNAVVTGLAGSSDFPATPGAYDTLWSAVFVAKVSPSGSALLWSTFLGADRAYSLALDGSGNAVVTGGAGPNFPVTPGAYDSSYNGTCCEDGFVAKICASGSELLWSTFLGGVFGDHGRSLALDASGDAVVAGYAGSPDFPTTPGAYDTTMASEAVFVSKIGIGCAGVTAEHINPVSAYLCPAFPDPFGASTTVQFFLPERERVSVAVYDVRGREVWGLLDAVIESGMHQFEWDGGSGDEASVAPGIYFIRMEAGSYRAATKIVLLR